MSNNDFFARPAPTIDEKVYELEQNDYGATMLESLDDPTVPRIVAFYPREQHDQQVLEDDNTQLQVLVSEIKTCFNMGNKEEVEEYYQELNPFFFNKFCGKFSFIT